MSLNSETYTEAFAQYMQSMIKLDALEKMTEDLDREIADSQSIMTEIKTIFNSIPNEQNRRSVIIPDYTDEDIVEYLESSVPKLLLPDISENNADLDMDNIIETMKNYAEELRKTLYAYTRKEPFQKRKIEPMDLTKYASSFDLLNKSLANIKINVEANSLNAELEEKLDLLCQDVQMFTQMIHAKEKMGEVYQNWKNIQVNNSALSYEDILSKLLLDINEVTYLLKNKN